MDAKLTILVPEEMRRRAKAAAALQGTTLSEVVRRALELYIQESEELALLEQLTLPSDQELLSPHDDV
jgi:predicted DNA-binding protein